MREPSDPGDEEERTAHGLQIEVVPKVAAGSASEFQLVKGPGAPYGFRLRGDHVIVGRSAEVHITIDSSDLSRRHAELVNANGQWSIRDLESLNGVFLNGVKIHSATLHDGDTVQLGNVVFVFREVRA